MGLEDTIEKYIVRWFLFFISAEQDIYRYTGPKRSSASMTMSIHCLSLSVQGSLSGFKALYFVYFLLPC